jgi:protein dithiol oxidoreductase (disulfide-forming)
LLPDAPHGALLYFCHSGLYQGILPRPVEIIIPELPMKIMTKWLFALLLPFVITTAWAAADFVEGTQYTRLASPQQTSVPDKIEVVEMFSYACPHCFHMEPELSAWLKSKPDDVAFVRLPVVFRPDWELLAKAYFTAQILGVLDKTHEALFEAIHEKNQKFGDEAAMQAFFVSQGVSADDFRNTFNSFAVAVKVNSAKLMTRRYAITGVPTFIVNGKFSTSASLVGGKENKLSVKALNEKTLQVVDYLVEQERAAGKPAASAAKSP